MLLLLGLLDNLKASQVRSWTAVFAFPWILPSEVTIYTSVTKDYIGISSFNLGTVRFIVLLSPKASVVLRDIVVPLRDGSCGRFPGFLSDYIDMGTLVNEFGSSLKIWYTKPCLHH
jgi:hypothetical protein